MGKTCDSFKSFALDERLHRALAQLEFSKPTEVQAKAIPPALAGKDVLARSRTGTGKTLAYALPLVNTILLAKTKITRTDPTYHASRALVLVPTRELAEQVATHIQTLCVALGDDGLVRVANVSGGSLGKSKGKQTSGDEVQRVALADKPDVVVATPFRALTYLRSGDLEVTQLQSLVIDEADLILSYGASADDIKAILGGSWGLPSTFQSFLMSATLTDDVEELQGIVLRNPEILMIEDREDDFTNLLQYAVRCSETDKFLLLYVILKLKLVRGKCLVFVNDTDRSYRVKLFLEKFGIKAGVLNAELPFNSRYHAVQDFNRGVLSYLIATDESESAKAPVPYEGQLLSTEPGADEIHKSSKKRKRDKTASERSSEYGVSRGIDFIDISCVVNFDLPASAKGYAHRIGRTARAGRTGTALSFVVPRAHWGKREKGLGASAEGVSIASAKHDEATWEGIDASQKGRGGVKDYVFDMKQVEGFRYRMEDALRSVTRFAVREARIKEIKNEVVNSEKLKAHFEDNPADLAFLKHDKPLHPSRIQPHLKHIPGYLMPQIGSVGPSANQAEAPLSVSFTKHPPSKKQKRPHRAIGGPGRRKEDPLKTFRSRRRT